jgi:glycosyltransferase involved in cell wall biosynthesis
MKIWLDLRFIWDNLYSTFVIELVKNLIKQDKENKFIIYTNSILEWFNFSNIEIKNVWIKNSSLKEQTTYLKILKNDKNNLMLFFNHYKPVFYVWNYFTILPSLKDIYYSDFSNHIEKYIFLYLLEKNLKKSTKIICFDKNTNDELIEKFNIEENKIKILPWFFPNWEKLNSVEDLKINIRTKYDIKNDFFIYSWWEWVEKNYEKLIHVFERLKKEKINIDLVFLWDTISKNIPLRNLILKLEMHKNIHFIWVIKPAEKVLFYKNSLWVIFSSFYEPFPFRLTEPLYFNTPIIASDLKNIKSIFWDTIDYISPISVNNIYEEIKRFIEQEKKEVNYEEIKKNYTKEITINKLLEIIK